MKPDGRADSALEQMLWAYAISARRAGRDVSSITLHEATTMYHAAAGVTPRRDDVLKWLSTIPKFLATVKE